MKIIDSHCHIHFQAYKDDRDEVIAQCIEKDVIMNTIGTFMGTSQRAVELAEKYDNIYATIGLHPTHLFPMDVNGDGYDFIGKAEDFDENFYNDLAKSDRVIGVGETGIDLFHMPDGVSRDDVLARQTEIFNKHVAFAEKHDLPLVIHVRDAHDEMLNIMEDEVRGVVHCFTSNWEHAQKYLEKGLYLGFTGVVTFPPKKTDPKPQEDLIEVIEKCPLDRILVETDAPYLAPQKYRGQRCEPWMVEEVISKIAEIKKLPREEVEQAVTENTLKLFNKIKL